MANVKLVNIKKTYDNNVTVIEDFNLEILDQEFIVFVGPSGCGKSTALRMIAGLEEISGGELYIDGVLSNNIRPKNRNIAMVFQTYALYPHWTVRKNLSFALEMQKVSKEKIEQAVEEVAQMLQMSELLDRYPRQMSGGQRQRVALGRALIRHPKVYLLDEPLSNLDAKLRGQMRSEITKLHQKTKGTFIYVTHDQIEALTMGTRIVVMNKGVIQQVATPQEIYNYPANLFVAAFIGSPPMNLFDVTVQKEGNKTKFRFDDHTTIEFADFQIPNKYLNQPIKLGVRPEHFKVDASGIKVDVSFIEDLGAELLVYGQTANQHVIAKLPSNLYQDIGKTITLSFPKSKIHLFDIETTFRIEEEK